MRFKDLKFTPTNMPKGVQSILHFGDYELSIINTGYGADQGLYEIGCFQHGKFVELPGITETGDTVKGYLTEDGVTSTILKMYCITGKEPIQG
jgi:phage tail protein X